MKLITLCAYFKLTLLVIVSDIIANVMVSNIVLAQEIREPEAATGHDKKMM